MEHAGTVVDSTITAPHYFNWFMTSHPGIAMRGRGTTTRPAHYTVLVDSSNLSMQDLENFTYRWTLLMLGSPFPMCMWLPGILHCQAKCTHLTKHLAFI